MKLVLKRLRRNCVKGPYIYISPKGPVKLEIGVPEEVEDEIAFKILEEDGDVIEKVEDDDAPKAKKYAVPKNKMHAPDEVK